MTEAKDLTGALGGVWFGSYGTAPCPVCQTERRKDQAALTLSDGHRGLLANCKKSNCSFGDILRAANVAPRRRNSAPAPQSSATHRGPSHAGAKSRHAKQLWDASMPVAGTPVETYLRDTRMITAQLPDALRFNPGTWHGPSRRNLPAMIARIDGSPGFAVTRTYLQPDGSGKAALAKGQQKMMLGPSAGGHVLLQSGPGSLVVAEGIETGLSLASGLVGHDSIVWATLAAPNMQSVQLPARPGQLIIAADGDAAGRTAGAALACRALALGWIVEMKAAPDGMDWNDVLIVRGHSRHSMREAPHHGL